MAKLSFGNSLFFIVDNCLEASFSLKALFPKALNLPAVLLWPLFGFPALTLRHELFVPVDLVGNLDLMFNM